jgi:hypothetical protein
MRTRMLMLSTLVVALGAAAPLGNRATQGSDCSEFCFDSVEFCRLKVEECEYLTKGCIEPGCECTAGLCCSQCVSFE